MLDKESARRRFTQNTEVAAKKPANFAVLPYAEISMLEDWVRKPIGERIEVNSSNYFQVLEVGPNDGETVVSMKSYISEYYTKLVQHWAGVGEDSEYACIRQRVPASMKPAEAFAEAEHLAREHFELSQMVDLSWDWAYEPFVA